MRTEIVQALHRILLCTAIAGVPAAYASDGGGSSVGGGGTVITLPDDTVVGADAYITTIPGPSGERFELGEKLREELGRVAKLLPMQLGYLYAYAYNNPDRKVGQLENIPYVWLRRTKFLDENMFAKSTHYFFVDELPRACRHETAAVRNLPEGSVAEAAGCTKGSFTFLIKSKFLRMSIREQAKYLMHERMHADVKSDVWDDEATIAKVINGVDVLLTQYDRELKNQFVSLTDSEIARLDDMAETINANGLLGYPKGLAELPVKRWKNGGATFTGDPRIAVDAYLGIAAFIDGKSQFASGAVFAPLNSVQCYRCDLGADARLAQVDLGAEYVEIHMNAHSRIERTRIQRKSNSEGWVTDASSLAENLFHLEMDSLASVQSSDLLLDYAGDPFSETVRFRGECDLNEARFEIRFTRRNHRIKTIATAPVSVPLGVAYMGAAAAALPLNLVMHEAPSDKMFKAAMKWTGGKLEVNFDSVRSHAPCAPIKVNRDHLQIRSGC